MPPEAEKDTSEQNEDVYEFILPPGIPNKIIIAACKEFNTDVVSIYADVETGLPEITSRNLLGFRADKETIEKIRKFVIGETQKFIDE